MTTTITTQHLRELHRQKNDPSASPALPFQYGKITHSDPSASPALPFQYGKITHFDLDMKKNSDPSGSPALPFQYGNITHFGLDMKKQRLEQISCSAIPIWQDNAFQFRYEETEVSTIALPP
ncbi:hypothetical protein PIB30_000294 [Stylosanthes scabra]|uniref:Uncharacterized protein n=1 Tax=Stylosanthes scabra TaxID=79078 RepID=A0ABU6T2Y3_9FABA|nr:hypothetical protein [Stylosanthes scabra]